MTQQQLINRIGLYLPTGWTYWSGFNRSEYNMEKSVGDVMILKTPDPYPAAWRARSSQGFNVTITLMLGKTVPIIRDTEQTQQHDPYEPIEVQQALRTEMDLVLAAITADAYMHIRSVDPVRFYPSAFARSVNSQIWADAVVQLRVWPVPGNVLPAILQMPLTCN